METSHNEEACSLIQSVYPNSVEKAKQYINPQALLWALIAVVLFVIYNQQPEKDNTLSIIQLTLVILCTVLAIVKLFTGNRRLIYKPTGSPIVRKERYYSISLEGDIRQCLKEHNTSRLNALKTDETGGILIETLESKDKAFTAVRMQKYCPEGYKPETEWTEL